MVKVCYYDFITPVDRMVFGEAAKRQGEAWLKLITIRAYYARNHARTGTPPAARISR